jgi:hypothetical protein
MIFDFSLALVVWTDEQMCKALTATVALMRDCNDMAVIANDRIDA